jgi:hypothetical protein
MKQILAVVATLIVGGSVILLISCSNSAAAAQSGNEQYIQEEGHYVTPTIDPNFGIRAPRACPVVTSPPTTAQANILVQCTMDYEARSMAVAHQDVSVKLGSARDPIVSDRERHLDVRSKIIPLVANATVFECGVANNVLNNIGANCTMMHYKNSPGECWKTFDGGTYRCRIEGTSVDFIQKQPPPKTF